MASTIQNTKLNTFLPFFAEAGQALTSYQQVYQEHRHRIYALAFWMTDNELLAEELMSRVFCDAFDSSLPISESLDRALLCELRELMPIGTLTLRCASATETLSVRRNILRVHLERSVVQLPPTERLVFLMHDVEGYDHERIARTLLVTQQESQYALHQARLRIRELLSELAS